MTPLHDDHTDCGDIDVVEMLRQARKQQRARRKRLAAKQR